MENTKIDYQDAKRKEYCGRVKDKIWKGIVNREVLIIKEEDRVFAEPALEEIAESLGVKILAKISREDERYIAHNSNVRGSRTVKVLVLDRESFETAKKFPEYDIIGGIIVPEKVEYETIPLSISTKGFFEKVAVKDTSPTVMY